MSISPASLPSLAGSLPVVLAEGSHSAITKRYVDAYRVAKFQTGIGTAVKIVSLIIGGLIAVISLLGMLSSAVPQPGFFGQSANSAGMALGFLGMVFGAVVAGVGFVLGILVSSGGQILKAELDCAVCANPFLNDGDRAGMMSL